MTLAGIRRRQPERVAVDMCCGAGAIVTVVLAIASVLDRHLSDTWRQDRLRDSGRVFADSPVWRLSLPGNPRMDQLGHASSCAVIWLTRAAYGRARWPPLCWRGWRSAPTWMDRGRLVGRPALTWRLESCSSSALRWLDHLPLRGWLAAVGAAWLAASVVSDVNSVHQALLVVAFVAFPAVLPRGRARWACAAVAASVAVELVPQHLVAVLFVAVAATVLVVPGSGAAWYPSGASLLVAAAVGLSWAQGQGHIGVDRELVVRVYELALAAVAACYPLAARAASNAAKRG